MLRAAEVAVASGADGVGIYRRPRGWSNWISGRCWAKMSKL